MRRTVHTTAAFICGGVYSNVRLHTWKYSHPSDQQELYDGGNTICLSNKPVACSESPSSRPINACQTATKVMGYKESLIHGELARIRLGFYL
jgi:hypothetical protein